MAMARARPTLFFMPPESWLGMRSSKPLKPTSSSFIFIIIFITFSSSFVCSLRARLTFSPTVIESKRAEPWNDMPTFFFIASISSSVRFVISVPRSDTLPESGLSEPIMCLKSVDFPQPEPPMITNVSPFFISRSMPFKMVRSPKRRTRFSTFTAVSLCSIRSILCKILLR